MSCPHGSGPPEQCSQCIGVTARKVQTRYNGEMLIDGVPTDRLFMPDTDAAKNRGGMPVVVNSPGGKQSIRRQYLRSARDRARVEGSTGYPDQDSEQDDWTSDE